MGKLQISKKYGHLFAPLVDLACHVLPPFYSKDLKSMCKIRMGRTYIQVDGKYMSLARYRAEQALGKKLNTKHPVHHVDLDKLNDENANLVVCESQSYHSCIHYLLHKTDS